MPTYRVKEGHRLLNGLTIYDGGDEVELDKESGALAVESGQVEESSAPVRRGGRPKKAVDAPEPDSGDPDVQDEEKK